MRRQGGYPWQNAGLSTGMAIGHLITQAATHGLTFGIIAASVYKVRLTTIPISFSPLAESDRAVSAGRSRLLCGAPLFSSGPAAVGVAQRTSQQREDVGHHRLPSVLDAHPVRRFSVLFADCLDRLRSGLGLWHGFRQPHLPVLCPYRIGPAYRLAGVADQHPLGPSRASRQQPRIPRQELWRRAADLGSSVLVLSGRAARHSDPLWLGASALGPQQPHCHRL